MKVYLVFQGCYSERDCKAVFDNKEQAEKYAELLEEEGCSDVEEFEVNEVALSDYKIITLYIATIYTKDIGQVKKGHIYQSEDKKVVNIKDKVEKVEIHKWFGYQIHVVSSISAEHAKKVAIEQYQIYTQQQLEDGEL